MKKTLVGKKPFLSKTIQLVLPIGVVVAIAFYTYQRIRNECVLLKCVPSQEKICGSWCIDPIHTTWKDAIRLMNDQAMHRQQGCLNITTDGRFTVNDLPDFTTFITGPISTHRNGSGRWWTGIDDMSGNSYIWLEFESIDETPVKDKNATSYFRCYGPELFLHIIIKDPDNGDVLVLRKEDA